MFNFLFNRSKQQKQEDAREIAALVVSETKKALDEFSNEIDLRFKEVQAQLRKIDDNFDVLEQKLQLKDLQDKQQYGHLTYKIHEVDLKQKKAK